MSDSEADIRASPSPHRGATGIVQLARLPGGKLAAAKRVRLRRNNSNSSNSSRNDLVSEAEALACLSGTHPNVVGLLPSPKP